MEEEEGVAPLVVVLKVDMHCDACALKIKECVKKFKGVEKVMINKANDKLTVSGKLDQFNLWDRLIDQIHREVEIVSAVTSVPNKEAAVAASSAPGCRGGGFCWFGLKKPAAPASVAPAGGGGGFRWFGWKRPAAAAAATDELNDQGAVTVVLKTRLDCYGCIKRVEKILLKVKGVKEIYADAESELVTVKGTVDANSLRVHLKRKLKRSVEIVSLKIDDGDNNDRMNNVKDAKTEDDNGGDGDGEWMEKEGGGGGEILKVERVARRQRMKEKLGDGGRESGYSLRKNS